MDIKQAVLSQLGTGKGKALPGRLLAQRLNQRDTRQIRLAIQELIEQGIPVIGSAKYGYFIAEDMEDCRENLEVLRSYGKMLWKHYKYLRLASRKFTGQLSLKL